MKRRSDQRSRILPALLSAIVFAGTVYVAYLWCYLPYRCNILERTAESSMLRAENLSTLQRTALARENLEQSLAWIGKCHRDLNFYMIAAASLRELGRSAEAIPIYQKSLTLDRRPEIYLNLGQAQAEAGQDGEAIPNLAAAIIFDPALITEVPATLQQKV